MIMGQQEQYNGSFWNSNTQSVNDSIEGQKLWECCYHALSTLYSAVIYIYFDVLLFCDS